MKLPLDFQKFFVENIQKIKNGLCHSSPRFARSFPPRGSHEVRRLNYWYQKTSYAPLFENFLKGKFSNKKEKHAFLHHRLSVGASPGGEKKPRNAALIFRFFRGGKLRDYHRYKYQRAAAKFYGGKRFL